MKLKTSNGILIDFKNKWAKSLTDYAKKLNFKNIKVGLATFPKGEKIYVVLENNIVIKENTSFDSVAVFLDMKYMVEVNK